ncbi:hypothetical protein EVAR_42826_1 [Eumeta japonica]|uniref:Uncharacterized protein n=1 Tax=Eumeta variegata TaxID=151549 RepID=A0A4C1WJ60_EUMVA|nr:hypothetical protein EVAR_42826_1 [Eumeta japonica]
MSKRGSSSTSLRNRNCEEERNQDQKQDLYILHGKHMYESIFFFFCNYLTRVPKNWFRSCSQFRYQTDVELGAPLNISATTNQSNAVRAPILTETPPGVYKRKRPARSSSPERRRIVLGSVRDALVRDRAGVGPARVVQLFKLIGPSAALPRRAPHPRKPPDRHGLLCNNFSRSTAGNPGNRMFFKKIILRM